MRSFINWGFYIVLMALPQPIQSPEYYYKFLIERLQPLLDVPALQLLSINTILQPWLSNRTYLNVELMDFASFVGWSVELSVMEVSLDGLLHLHIILNKPPSYTRMRSFWRQTNLLKSDYAKHVHLANIKSVKATLQYLSKQMPVFRDFTIIM